MTRCLIVDEDRDWRERLLVYCASHGLDYVAADSEEAAIQHCAAAMPDVVFVGTRQAAGFIRQLRRLGGDDPIVIHCPEQGDTTSVTEAIWNGATDYMFKQCSRAFFDAKLRQTGIV